MKNMQKNFTIRNIVKAHNNTLVRDSQQKTLLTPQLGR